MRTSSLDDRSTSLLVRGRQRQRKADGSGEAPCSQYGTATDTSAHKRSSLALSFPRQICLFSFLEMEGLLHWCSEVSSTLGGHAAVTAAYFFTFQFHLLEHEIYFLSGKFEFCSEAGDNKASTGRATLTLSCSRVYKLHRYVLLHKIKRTGSSLHLL